MTRTEEKILAALEENAAVTVEFWQYRGPEGGHHKGGWRRAYQAAEKLIEAGKVDGTTRGNGCGGREAMIWKKGNPEPRWSKATPIHFSTRNPRGWTE